MDLNLHGKVALVTGASRGIGAAIGSALAAEGCRIAATARDENMLASLVATCTNVGSEALAVADDLRDPGAAGRIVSKTLERFGRLDILVANAGSAQAGDIFTLPDAAWTDAFELKFFGHMRLIRAAWPSLVKAAGSVTIIGGFAGRTPLANAAINGSVNAALLSFTKALALRGRDDRVRVNAVNPGQVRTQRFARRVQALVESEGIDEAEAEARMARDFGMLRTGEPEDVADMVTFIASERASFLHGSLVDLDGGMTKSI